MSQETRIARLRETAVAANALGSWLALERAMRAAGVDAQECVEPLLLLMGEAVDLSDEDYVLLDELDQCHRIDKGARVRYANTRARAKFKSGRRVDVGTEGEILWLGQCQFSGAPKVGVKTDDGEVFFTAMRNVEGPVDSHAVFVRRQEVKAYVDRHWPQRDGAMVNYSAGRFRGLSVADAEGNVGVIFWARWQGADLRIGFKPSRAAEPTWTSITDVVPA